MAKKNDLAKIYVFKGLAGRAKRRFGGASLSGAIRRLMTCMRLSLKHSTERRSICIHSICQMRPIAVGPGCGKPWSMLTRTVAAKGDS